MKHSYVTLDYSRFEVIPTGVIRTKFISVKPLSLFIILSYHNQYGYFNVHNFFFLYECLRVDVHVSTSITVHYHAHLIPFMYDFMID